MVDYQAERTLKGMHDLGKKLVISVDALWLLGAVLQEDEDSRQVSGGIPYLDLEGGRVAVFIREEREQVQEVGTRYIEIPSIPHWKAHELLDEFIAELGDSQAQESVEEVRGIGETLLILEDHGRDRWEFTLFVARKWLASLGIETEEV